MRISYDKQVDALAIVFRDTTVTTEEVADGISMEYDADGKLAGIEILDAMTIKAVALHAHHYAHLLICTRKQNNGFLVIYYMSPLAQQLIALSVEERMQIVRDLWDSIVEDESIIPVSEEDKAEVRRRLELLRRGELQTENWETMRARIVANRP